MMKEKQVKTAKDVEQLIKNKENVQIVSTLFSAIAYEQTVKSIIEPEEQKILEEHKFMTSLEIYDVPPYRIESKQITKKFDMYRASDEDHALYWAKMNEVHDKLGFKKESYDHCPILVAESMVRDARYIAINALEPYTGISYDRVSYNTKRLNQYTDLILKMFASEVDEYNKANK